MLSKFPNVASDKNIKNDKKIFHHLSTPQTKQLIQAHKVSILSFNAQSINKRIDEINILAKEIDYPSVINICETWHPFVNLSIQNYHCPIIKTRPHKRGGGVAIYCHSNNNFNRRTDLETDNTSALETITAEIVTKSGYKFLSTSAYFPPNIDYKICLVELEKLATKLNSTKLPYVISGDFNIDTLKPSKKYDAYSSKLQSLQLTQHIQSPTRITTRSETLIDHIISNPKITPTCKVLINQIADHQITLAVFKKSQPQNKQTIIEKYVTNTTDLTTQINNHNWKKWIATNKNKNPDQIATNFTKVTTSIFNDNTKRKKISRNLTPKKNWITLTSLQLRQTVQQLRKKFLKTRKPQHESKYKATKKSYEKSLRNDKRNYYLSELEKCKGDSKRIWEIINEVTGRKSKKTITIPENTSLQQTACDLNLFFQNIAINIQKNIPAPAHDFNHYLKKSNKQPQLKFSLSPISRTEVEATIKNLSCKTSSGFDNLSNKIVKTCKQALAEPISIIVNKSFESGEFPDSLKISKIFPLFKSGDKNSLNNYRPISQLSTISKVIETIAINQLTAFLNKNKILSKFQFGFREKHSTEHALLAIKQNLEHNRALNNFTVMVSIDLSKAFDTVNSSEILIDKLKYYGCDAKTQSWFKSFFTNRRQYVQIENTKSNTIHNHDISVVQGSTCGPKMFSVYINDLPEVTNLKTYLFADDTTLAISGPNLETIMSTLQTELDKIADYFKANKLSLNAQKSTYIIIPPKKRCLTTTTTKQITIGNHCLARSREVKFLGILLDENLTFNNHFQQIKSKSKTGIAALCSVKYLLPYQAKKLIYYGLFHSHISYCPLVWGSSITKQQTNELQKMQKKAIRLLFKTNPGSHTFDLFRKSKIIKFENQFQLNSNILVNNHINNLTPDIFADIIPLNTSSSTRTKIKYPHEKSETIIQIVKQWKSLESIVFTAKPNIFKNRIKHKIISKYVNDCNTKNCQKCENYNENFVKAYMKT